MAAAMASLVADALMPGVAIGAIPPKEQCRKGQGLRGMYVRILDFRKQNRGAAQD
jgi:hypothetical protein